MAFLHQKEIKVHLEWPGYEPFCKRLRTTNGEVTRDALLIFLGKLMREFLAQIQTHKAVVSKKYEVFSICRPDRTFGAINPFDTMITAIHHRGGAN